MVASLILYKQLEAESLVTGVLNRETLPMVKCPLSGYTVQVEISHWFPCCVHMYTHTCWNADDVQTGTHAELSHIIPLPFQYSLLVVPPALAAWGAPSMGRKGSEQWKAFHLTVGASDRAQLVHTVALSSMHILCTHWVACKNLSQSAMQCKYWGEMLKIMQDWLSLFTSSVLHSSQCSVYVHIICSHFHPSLLLWTTL